MRWTLVKCLALLSLVVVCQCQAQQKFSILYKAQGGAGAFANLGTIDYDFNSGVSNVAISDQEAYTAILKNVQQTYLFEFKFPAEGRTALKSLVKISKGTTALGFQVHGSTSQAVTAVNVLSEGKSKTAFVRIVKPDRGDFVNPTPASDFVPEFDDVEDPVADVAPGAPNADSKGKIPRQKPIQEEKKPQPWYKEYFWYIVIGGFFLYRIMNIDKTALSEQLAEAKKQAEEIQNKKAAKKDK